MVPRVRYPNGTLWVPCSNSKGLTLYGLGLYQFMVPKGGFLGEPAKPRNYWIAGSPGCGLYVTICNLYATIFHDLQSGKN